MSTKPRVPVKTESELRREHKLLKARLEASKLAELKLLRQVESIERDLLSGEENLERVIIHALPARELRTEELSFELDQFEQQYGSTLVSKRERTLKVEKSFGDIVARFPEEAILAAKEHKLQEFVLEKARELEGGSK